MVFICKVFQSRLQVGQFKWSFPDVAHIKAIAAFIARVQHLAETLLRKIRHGKPQWYQLHFSWKLRHSWMVESHSLMLVSWQKAISPITFCAVQLSAWSPQQNDLKASFKQQVTKRFFRGFSLAKIGCLGLLAGLSYFFPSLLFCYTLSQAGM